MPHYDLNEIKDGLKKELAGYMIPSNMQVIDSLPLTANRKIDRRVLERWSDIGQFGSNSQQEEIVVPLFICFYGSFLICIQCFYINSAILSFFLQSRSKIFAYFAIVCNFFGLPFINRDAFFSSLDFFICIFKSFIIILLSFCILFTRTRI